MKIHGDVAAIGGLVVVLGLLSLVAYLQGSREIPGRGPAAPDEIAEKSSGPVTVIRVDATGLPRGPETGGKGSEPGPEVGEVIDAEDLDPEDVDRLDLEAYDVILPGGLVLARPGQELVPNAPAGLGGLVVHDRSGRLYYTTDDGNWSTIWFIDQSGGKHSLWTGRTEENRIELAAATSEELWLVMTTAPPFQKRRQAWEHADRLRGLRILNPGATLFDVSVSDELVETVLRFCERDDK